MADNAVEEGARYWAFISYSHKDAAFGRRLHARLESYVLPQRLVGRTTAQGPVPRRLVPIFRDREELPAAHDLSAEVRAALKASRSLIVVCSPAAAGSRWVGREVEVFRALHPDRPILAAVRDGEPADCFPPSLRIAGADGELVEPLAADFRRGRDGEQLGLLKLVAGIVGIGLDELVQRDAQRKSRRVTAVTAGALVLALVMGLLAVFALNARSEAERQRSEAEGLVEFMLTDLRDRLKGVGRLDVMTAVNQRALHYYDREIDSVPPDSLAERALVLQAIGADDETRGDHKDSDRKFREAFNITASLLAADPNNPERIFDHAQSEYWMGYAAYTRDQIPQARSAFQQYKSLAAKMVALAPTQPRYLRELAYAEGDLCSVAFNPPKDPPEALKWCKLALVHMEHAAHRMTHSATIESDLYNRRDWLADAYHANGDDTHATAERLVAERSLDNLIKADPMNMDFKFQWIALQRNLARAAARSGDRDQAKSRLNRASILIDQMIVFDSNNSEWRGQKRKLDAELSKIELEFTREAPK